MSAAPFDLGALDAIAKRSLTVSSDIEVVFRALPGLIESAHREAEWRRVYALVWSIIHGENVDAPLPPIGPRGLVSAAAEFAAMRAVLKATSETLAEVEHLLSICRRDFEERGRIIAAANARIAGLEAGVVPNSPEPVT